jgi:DNA polymerase III gamma/tau subunit
VRAGTHPDLLRLGRDKATVISVAALQPMLLQAHRRPGQGRHQVFEIEPADALEPEGVARYLKTLEEPPSGTVFLLLTTRPERLPDTVRSRCRRLGFPPLPGEEIAARLRARGQGGEAAAALARVASGSLERALRLADADVIARVGEAWQAAHAAEPCTGRTVDGLLAALEVAAATRTEAQQEDDAREGRGVDRRRESLRSVLQDLLHVVAVEAREAAAGRAAFGDARLAPRAALDLLERAGRLSAAVAANVTPAVVLHDLLGALRVPTRA